MLTRRAPHPVRLAGALITSELISPKKLPSMSSYLKGKQKMPSAQPSHTLIRGWNAFAKQADGHESTQWIPEPEIVGIGEDFHSQLDDEKTKTTRYRLFEFRGGVGKDMTERMERI